MDLTLVQAVINVVFSGYLLYLSPLLFLLMIVLFADRLIDLLVNSISPSTKRRRG